MKKANRSAICFVMITACLTLMACSKKEEDFDATGYVKASMDAVFHGEYTEYAKFLDISEKEAKKNMEQEFEESIKQEFTAEDGISEEGLAQYTELMRQVDNLAKYEVKEAKKTDDGDYIVKVQVEPSDVYQTLEQSSTEVSNEKIEQGLEPTDPDVFASVLTESVQKSIDKNTYGKATTIEVKVTKDESGSYGLDETEMDKLREALFPD